MSSPSPKCVGCRKTPAEVEEYDAHIDPERGILTADDGCRAEEGTYNKEANTYYCAGCYIRAGQPLGKAPDYTHGRFAN